MSLSTLIDGIAGEAQAEAERIRGQAQQEAAQLLDAARAAAEAEAAQLRRTHEADARRQAAQRVAQARLEARNHLLRVRQELVDDAFARALAALAALDDDRYRAAMKRRILEACTAPDEAVVVSARDRARLTPAWQQEVAAALRDRTGAAALPLRFDGDDAGGGFVVQHPRYEVDMRFRSLLQALGNDKRAEIAAILFGQ